MSGHHKNGVLTLQIRFIYTIYIYFSTMIGLYLGTSVFMIVQPMR